MMQQVSPPKRLKAWVGITGKRTSIAAGFQIIALAYSLALNGASGFNHLRLLRISKLKTFVSILKSVTVALSITIITKLKIFM
jgi:hypothetical protein